MNTIFNQQQRKEFDRALQDIRRRAVSTLSDQREDARTAVVRELLETFDGADALATSVMRLHSELEAAEEKLMAMGFERGRDGDIELAYRAPENVKEVYEQRVEQRLQPFSEKVEAIDTAIRNAWTISTLPEAMKIVKQFA